MNKVCRIADSHERTARVNVVLPTIQVLVILEREKEPPVFRLKEETIGLNVDPLYVGDILKFDRYRHDGGLEGMKA